MTDCSGSMTCTAQKSELSPPSINSSPPSQASTSTTDHNHHGHLMKVLKGHEGEKIKSGCSNSYNVDEHNEQRNGCLHDDTVSEFSENTVHNEMNDDDPKVLRCGNMGDHDLCLHITKSSLSNSLSVLNNPKSGLDKVNGLKHTVAEHSTSDSSRLVNLLNNTHSSETTEEELQSHISCNLVPSQGSNKELNVRQSDFVVSHNEVGTINECSYEVPCGSELCDCLEALANELGKTSLQELSNCSELLTAASTDVSNTVSYVVYESEKQMPDIMRLITKDLSEPYSIYTYRYFIHNWPKLCILAMVGNTCVGAIVCKLDLHKKMVRRGYIAMLAVDSEHRRKQIGSTLVTKAIEAMMRDDCDEVVLETEITNEGALRLYENLGFVRDKRLFRYYLNGVDALRLKLWLR